MVRKNEPLVAIDAHVGVVLVQVAVGDLLWQTQRVRCEVVPERAGPAKVAVDDENLTVGRVLCQASVGVQVEAKEATCALLSRRVVNVAVRGDVCQRLALSVVQEIAGSATQANVRVGSEAETVGNVLGSALSVVVGEVARLTSCTLILIENVSLTKRNQLLQASVVEQVVADLAEAADVAGLIIIATVQVGVARRTDTANELQILVAFQTDVLVDLVQLASADVLRQTKCVVFQIEAVLANFTNVGVEFVGLAIGTALLDTLKANNVVADNAGIANASY